MNLSSFPIAEGDTGLEEAPLGRPPGRWSLRAKGIAAILGLVLYLVLVAIVVSNGRHKLLMTVEELERLHRNEEMLVHANITAARAILGVNEQYGTPEPDAMIGPVFVELEAVQASLQGLRINFPELSGHVAALDAAGRHLREKSSRGDLAVIRSGLHDLVSVLDVITLQEREKKQKLLSGYRVSYDAVTLEIAVLGLLGLVVLGGTSALFFSRLAWDIGKLHERAKEIVSGYRGVPLEVTRGDEVGGLMAALNTMQTELRERETQLELSRQQRFHQEKMAAVGSLAAALAHEINNPLAAIAGIAESISEERNSHCRSGGSHCQPELIIEQARRVAAITRQIAEFSTPHSLEPSLLDLNALVRSTCNFVSYDRRFKNIELRTELDSQLPAIHAVGDHLTQVLMNLLINSADAMEELDGRRPVIAVRTEALDGNVTLTVADNGVGMVTETRAHAFEEFYTTKPVGRGSGLGLALCKSLIEGHSGSISLDSTPGEGTQVVVTLPLGYEAKAAA